MFQRAVRSTPKTKKFATILIIKIFLESKEVGYWKFGEVVLNFPVTEYAEIWEQSLDVNVNKPKQIEKN